jgi:hypothetical protein
MRGSRRIDPSKFPELIEYAQSLGFGLEFPTCVTDNTHFLALADKTCCISVAYEDEIFGCNPYIDVYIHVLGNGKCNMEQAKATYEAFPSAIKILERFIKEVEV